MSLGHNMYVAPHCTLAVRTWHMWEQVWQDMACVGTGVPRLPQVIVGYRGHKSRCPYAITHWHWEMEVMKIDIPRLSLGGIKTYMHVN